MQGKCWVAGILCRWFRVGWEGDDVDVGVAELSVFLFAAEDVGLVVDDGDGVMRTRQCQSTRLLVISSENQEVLGRRKMHV